MAKTGRPKKWPEGRTMIPVEVGDDQAAEIDDARTLIRVKASKKPPRPMNRGEFSREAMRGLVSQVKEGTYEPPTSERPYEAEVEEVLPWPRCHGCGNPATVPDGPDLCDKCAEQLADELSNEPEAEDVGERLVGAVFGS